MEVFGAYRVISLLGEGGMGAVYLGEHTLLGRRAAIKVLRADLSQRPDVVDRFFTEARAASSVADPGIVQIFDFGYQDATAYLVMEFLDGESLDARLSRLGRLHVEDVARIGRQLALSLHAAHACGVVHRDLKPDNVFLVADAEVPGGERTKILDFGIAKLTGEKRSTQKTQTGFVFGTPLYMSPEQCRGAGEVDHRSDIYSLGCVLFHLACGKPPFDAEGAGELLAMHLREAPPLPSGLVEEMPTYLEEVLVKCLEKTPEHRFHSMQELAAALVEPVIELDVRKPRRRWPLALAIGGVLTAGGAAALVLASDDAASTAATAAKVTASPAASAAPTAQAVHETAVPTLPAPQPPQAAPAQPPQEVAAPIASQPPTEREPAPHAESSRVESSAARASASHPAAKHVHRAPASQPIDRASSPGPVTRPEPAPPAIQKPTPKPEPEPTFERAPKRAPALPDDPYGDR